jgi:hypothetical protein
MVVFILLNQSFLPFQQQSHRFLQFEPLQCGHVFSCVAVSVGFNMAIWQILHSGWETSDFILQGRKPKLAIKVGTENIFYPKLKQANPNRPIILRFSSSPLVLFP